MTGPTPPREPISREDWRAYRREMWRRQRGGEWHGGPPAFGCLFALIVLIVFGSLVAASGLALSSYGPLPVVVTALVLVAVFIAIGRVFRRSARTLDELVDAVARVEAGDYSIRLSVPERGMRPVRQLVRGFNTMTERLERDEDRNVEHCSR